MSDFIPNNEHFLKRARNIRNELLNKTDRYILSDYPITPEQQMIIKSYRQELREFPARRRPTPGRSRMPDGGPQSADDGVVEASELPARRRPTPGRSSSSIGVRRRSRVHGGGRGGSGGDSSSSSSSGSGSGRSS